MNELAERAGISQTFISRLESGERGASRENVEALASALQVSDIERYRMLVAAQWMAPLGPPLDQLVEILWSDGLPSDVRARLLAAIEIAVAYGRAALEPDSHP